MTQLDLPPISFARYLDLLKRRRWQVLPVSLLGLLVGGVVAFLIPRYYVCKTVIQFQGEVLQPAGGPKDPMEPLIDSAEIGIRYSVGKALADLGWPEAMVGDEDERRAFEEAVRLRVDVVDLGPADRQGRMTANLQISYRDTEGVRAKELTEELRNVWIKEQKAELQQMAQDELDDVNRRIKKAAQRLDHAEFELTTFERDHDFDPQEWIADRDRGQSPKGMERATLETELLQWEAERDGLRAAIAAKGEQLSVLEPTIEQTEVAPVEGPVLAALNAARFQLIYVQRALSNVNPNHQSYKDLERRKVRAEEQLAALKKLVGVDEKKTVPNPDWKQLRGEIDDLQGDLRNLDAKIARHSARLAVLRAEFERLPQLKSDYRAMLDERDAARAALGVIVTERTDKDAQRRRLEAEPYKVIEFARVPPRPTEPNITLVALAGSAVGLAVAIGLILLFDVLQSTFKTVADVEHALALPVLGGIAHMETVEQRQQVRARRTRYGLVAGLFLLLSVSLVTIYYVAPTRLPPVVRDGLDLILGTPSDAANPR